MTEQKGTVERTHEEAVMTALAALHGVPRPQWWETFQRVLGESGHRVIREVRVEPMSELQKGTIWRRLRRWLFGPTLGEQYREAKVASARRWVPRWSR